MAEQQPPRDRTLVKARTHYKVLFLPALLQIVFIALHIFVIATVPAVGDHSFNRWFHLTLHALIICFELIYSIVPFLRWLSDTFEVTENRVRTDSGIVNRNHQEIQISRISQVDVERGLLDRIFGSGSIILYDASNTLGMTFKDVPRVKSVKDMIDSRRGL